MPSAGYSGTPLVKKLGIKPASTLVLLGAPRGFKRELVGLPHAVRIAAELRGAPELTIWFLSSKRELEGRIPQIAASMGQGLWIAWPKKASGTKTDVTEDIIRNCALPHGIVDYKVCAINETWSGLKFARRQKLR
jgi:hypothetical protein